MVVLVLPSLRNAARGVEYANPDSLNRRNASEKGGRDRPSRNAMFACVFVLTLFGFRQTVAAAASE